MPLYQGPVTGLFDLKGSTDCSSNPNYPVALQGDTYKVSVAGKIGGASGVDVEVGDFYVATADNAGGTQAAVGSSWTIVQGNITGAVTAAAVIDDNTIVAGDGGVRGVKKRAITIGDVSGNNVSVTATTGNSLTLATLDGNKDVAFVPHGSGVVRSAGNIFVFGSGTAGASSTLPAFSVAGTRTLAGTAFHGYSDESTIAGATGIAADASNSFDAKTTIGAGSGTFNHHAAFQSRPTINATACPLVYGFYSTGVRTAGLAAATWSDVYGQPLTGGGALDTRCFLDDATSTSDATNTICLRSTSGSRSYHLGTFAPGISGYSGVDVNYFLHIGNTAATANKGALKVTGYSITGSSTQSMFNLAGTLNTSGSVDVLTMDITNTASGAATNLINLKVGSVSMFNVTKLGDFQIAGGFTAAGTCTAGAGSSWVCNGRSKWNSAGADGLFLVTNNAGNGLTRFILGTNDSSGLSFAKSTTTLTFGLGDGSAGGTFANSGVYKASTQALSGPGAANITTETTKITTTGVLDAISLADGVDGQIKRVIHDVDGGSFVLTPTTKTGWTTFTSTAVGESISLQFVTTRGWMVIGSFGGVIA